jgi:hypothetical protein
MTLYDQQTDSTRVERRVVREVRVRSVFRVAFWLSLSLWGIAGVGLVALYIVGAAAGGLGGFRGLMASLGLTGIWVNPLAFLPVFAVISVAFSVAGAASTAVVAMLYNALTPLVGGVEIVERARW